MRMRDIKRNIENDIRGPVLNVCQEIVDRLAGMEPSQLERLTYMLLAGFAKRSPDDETFQSALTALTTIKCHPLTLYFVFFDEDDDREIAISASEAMRSVDDNVFVHPRTGEAVRNFTNQLKPVFRASKEFVDALMVDDGH